MIRTLTQVLDVPFLVDSRGYMAPEYALWGHLTYKADVYSFGIVLLEIVSGKSNSNFMPTNNCVCLLDWVLFSSLLYALMILLSMKPILHIFAAFPSTMEHSPESPQHLPSPRPSFLNPSNFQPCL